MATSQKIRNRTGQEQILYDALMPRLCSGESAAKISRETGIPVQTLRAWKSRAKKRNGGKLPGNAAVIEQQSEAQPPATISAETVREFLLTQGETAAPLLKEFNEKIAKGLERGHSALMAAFDVLHARLAEKTKEVVMHDDGSSYIGSIQKNSADLALEVKALSGLVERFAAFHCIPHGALKTESLRFAPAAVSNHLHLHSHGAKNGRPAKALEPARMQPIDVTPANSDRMSGTQAQMVEALED